MKIRIVVVAIGTFGLFSLLIAQYFKIQILEGEKWTQAALAQHEFILKEPARRGTFYSNVSVKIGHPESPQPLVFDVTKFHLFIDPVSIPEKYRDEVADQMIQIAGIPEEMRGEFERKSRSRRLANWLDREKKEAIWSWWVPYAKQHKIPRNAIYFVTDFQRSYPFGNLLGQVLHTIREMKDEATSEGLPTGGLEAYFNDFLKGKMGKRKLLRSPLNHLEIDKVIEEPANGADIYLTINHCIQAIMEEELREGVQAAKAKGGWAVMMDPHSGEILGLAQYPYFSPANYREFFNHPEKLECAKVKAVTDAFELGSIMKPITLSIGLKANLESKKKILDPNEKVDVTRTIFPGRASRPLRDPRPYKALNMFMALQKSSNIFMAEVVDRLIQELGNDWYRKALVETFGFGQKTGIELPAEAVGIVPTPGKMHPNGTLEWSTPTPYSLAIGYNLLSTSLQMVRAYAVFANGGYLVKPTLVRRIMRGDEALYDLEMHKKFPQVLDSEIVNEVFKAMKFTTKPGGTGSLAEINGYTEAGKTGTAEKIIGGAYAKRQCISSFIGFAPANLDPSIPPRFVLIVTVDEPAPIFLEGGLKNYVGGRCAAPIFREIAKRTLDYLGLPLDDPYGYPNNDPRYRPDSADWMSELRSLNELFREWNAG